MWIKKFYTIPSACPWCASANTHFIPLPSIWKKQTSLFVSSFTTENTAVNMFWYASALSLSVKTLANVNALFSLVWMQIWPEIGVLNVNLTRNWRFEREFDQKLEFWTWIWPEIGGLNVNLTRIWRFEREFDQKLEVWTRIWPEIGGLNANLTRIWSFEHELTRNWSFRHEFDQNFGILQNLWCWMEIFD